MTRLTSTSENSAELYKLKLEDEDPSISIQRCPSISIQRCSSSRSNLDSKSVEEMTSQDQGGKRFSVASWPKEDWSRCRELKWSCWKWFHQQVRPCSAWIFFQFNAKDDSEAQADDHRNYLTARALLVDKYQGLEISSKHHDFVKILCMENPKLLTSSASLEAGLCGGGSSSPGKL